MKRVVSASELTGEPGVHARVVTVATALFLVTAAFILARTARDALFLLREGLFDLPRAYIGIALLAAPVAALAVSAMRMMGVRHTRVWAVYVVAISLVGYAYVARPGGGWPMTVCFVLLPLVFGVLFSLTWLLGAELLDRIDAGVRMRAYRWFGAASIAGGTIGGLAARTFSMRMEPQRLLVVAAAVLACAGVVILFAHRACRVHAHSEESMSRAALRDDFRALIGQRYVLRLLAVGMMTAVVGILVEFQFFLVAAAEPGGARGHAHFFASVYLVFNACALALQLLLMTRLQRTLGVYRSLLLLPAVLVLGSATLFASAAASIRLGVRIVEGGFKSSIHRSNWEQAYLPVARQRRAGAKLLVDGLGARLSEGVVAVLLYLWLHHVMSGSGDTARHIVWVRWALMVATVLWMVLVRGLGDEIEHCAAIRNQAEELRLGSPLPDG